MPGLRTFFVQGVSILVALGFGSAQLYGQAVEKVLVETYAVTSGKINGEPPLITYRIYVDMAPGYQLQMVYGDMHHQLVIRTSTDFFNDPENDTRYGDRVSGDHLNSYPYALDSWLTIARASDRHVGVPRELDTDGSILECPPYADLGATTSKSEELPLKPLCIVDGLMKDTTNREVVNFNLPVSYMGGIRGGELETTNGAWALLGGMMGTTPENMVLIAQLSTNGQLSFKLNLQIGTPDHEVLKYVSSDPMSGELVFEGLSFGAFRAPRADR